MEFLLLYLDDLDDLYSMAGLVKERIWRGLLKTLSTILAISIAVGAMALAQMHAPLALATLVLLFVTLLYRVVTAPTNVWMPSDSR